MNEHACVSMVKTVSNQPQTNIFNSKSWIVHWKGEFTNHFPVSAIFTFKHKKRFNTYLNYSDDSSLTDYDHYRWNDNNTNEFRNNVTDKLQGGYIDLV